MKRISGVIVAMCLVAFLVVPGVALAIVDVDGDGICDIGDGDGICDIGGGDGIPDYDGDGLKHRGGR